MSIRRDVFYAAQYWSEYSKEWQWVGGNHGAPDTPGTPGLYQTLARCRAAHFTNRPSRGARIMKVTLVAEEV